MNFNFSSQIFSVILLSIILNKTFDYAIILFNDDIRDTPQNQKYSSVWCYGHNHTDRRCRFANLCYKKDTLDYIFLFEPNFSIISGVPSDRFSPALLDLSSVADHNKFYFNYVEIPYSVLESNLTKSYKIIEIKGNTLIFARFKPDNLMHLFHDDIIPLHFTYNELGAKHIQTLFVDDDWPPITDRSLYSSEYLYNSLFKKVKVMARRELNDNTIYCFEEAFVGLSKSSTWYDYGFRSPQSPIARTPTQQQLISVSIKTLARDLMSTVNCSTYFATFLSRKYTRKILNEHQILRVIAENTDLTVQKLGIEEMLSENFENIIRNICCTKILIGMHGSALVLSMFLRQPSSVIELFPYAINPENYTPYKTLTQLMGINYLWWRNENLSHTITHPEYPKELGGIQHLSTREQTRISLDNNEVRNHLCCSDQFWLYRIYQDTIVDINSIKPVIVSANRMIQYSISESDTHSLKCGYVQHLNCQKHEINNTHFEILITWREPWNLVFIRQIDLNIFYELLIQEVPSNSAKYFKTTEKQHIFTSDVNKTFNVWVRCKLNEHNGPYNLNPLFC